MEINKRVFVLSMVVLSVLTVLLSMNFASAALNITSPIDSGNYTMTNVLFNVSYINNTDIGTPLNFTIWASPNGNATRITLGNTSATGCTDPDNSKNNACWVLLNFSIANGNYTINITMYNATNATGVDVLGSVNASQSVIFDSVAPAVVADVKPQSGWNITNGTYIINVSVTDSLIGIQAVFFNITNITGTQIDYLNATNATAGYWNATWNLSLLGPGVYNITVYANDSLNNLNKTTVISEIRFDALVPTNVNVTSINSSFNVTGNIKINITAYDLNSSIGGVMINITNSTGVQNATIFGNLETGNIWVVNLSTAEFADGNYNLTFYVNDTAGNVNSSIVLSNITFDNSAPSASLSCTPNPVEQGDTITCSCSGSDSISGIRTTGSITPTPSTTDSGPHTVSCTVTNYVGLETTASYEYTVSGSAATGTSSGSGSSGSASGTTGAVQRTYSIINAGEAKTITGLDATFGLKTLEITVNNKAQDIKVIINKYDGKPASVTIARTGKVYKYFEINAPALASNIITAKMTVQVTKAWVTQNSLDKDKVAVYRLANNAWTELPTNFVSEDATNFVLEAETPGFSFFAISEKVAQAVETGNQTGSGDGTGSGAGTGATGGEEDTTTNSNMLWWILGIIVVIVVIVVIVYFVKRK